MNKSTYQKLISIEDYISAYCTSRVMKFKMEERYKPFVEEQLEKAYQLFSTKVESEGNAPSLFGEEYRSYSHESLLLVLSTFIAVIITAKEILPFDKQKKWHDLDRNFQNKISEINSMTNNELNQILKSLRSPRWKEYRDYVERLITTTTYQDHYLA